MEEAWNGMEEALYLEHLIDFLRTRLTNITVYRYVDDLMLYGYKLAKVNFHVRMALHKIATRRIGPEPLQTKILHNSAGGCSRVTNSK